MRPHLKAWLKLQLGQLDSGTFEQCLSLRYQVTGSLGTSILGHGHQHTSGLFFRSCRHCVFFSAIRRCQNGFCGQYSGNGLQGDRLRSKELRDSLSHHGLRESASSTSTTAYYTCYGHQPEAGMISSSHCNTRRLSTSLRLTRFFSSNHRQAQNLHRLRSIQCT